MNCLRLEKSLRSLTKRRDFEKITKGGISSSSKYILVYARLNELNYNRLGFSISKKIGKAVIRNRIKRLLRVALRRLLHGVPLNYDFVIIAKKPSVEAGLDEFIRDIKKTLIKVEEFNDVSLQRT